MKKTWFFKKLNNKGAGIVTVIVAIALVSILASIVLTGSYMNYKVKQTNLHTRDNFYTAEVALDEINIGLQYYVSNAVSTAYLNVMQEYGYYGASEKNELMESIYYNNLWGILAGADASYSTYDLSVLNGMISPAYQWDATTNTGVLLTSTDNKMVTYENTGIVLKNLEIYYRDASGYSTTIRTDIRLVCPTMQFGSATALPDVIDYAIVADEGLTIGTGTNNSTNVITGNIYAGEMNIQTQNGKKVDVTFESAGNLISRKGINLKNAEVTFPTDATLWTTSIVLDSSAVSLLGTTNISNDLKLNGTNSSAVIKNRFNAYGNSLDNPDESSAILVNGTGASIDFTDVDIVTISGHAFIGTRTRNKGSVSGTAPSGKSVLTGESISVKSNQIMYLVPAECIGVRKSNVNGVTTYNGSAYGQNPLSSSQYLEITGNPDSYEEVRTDVLVQDLGKSLANYIKFVDGKPQVEKVFVQSNSGQTMVYYYMVFASEDTANLYFRDYYSLNQANIDDYLKFYTTAIKLPSAANLVRLQTAGNLLKYSDSGDVTLVQNTLDSASSKLEATTLMYKKQMETLCTKLIVNNAELGDNLKYTYTDIATLGKDIVFDNIVDKDRMVTFINNQGAGAPKSIQFVSSDGSNKAVLVANEGNTAYHYDNTTVNQGVHLIIATGDVSVDTDFTGLILANGKITIKDGVKVTADTTLSKGAMRISKSFGTSTYSPVNFLWDGADALSSGGLAGAVQSLKLSDLIIYENWTKN